MNEPDRDRSLQRRVVAALDRHAGELDPELRQRLDRARRQALAEPQRRRPRFAWPALAAAGAAALVAVAIVVGPDRDASTGVPALPVSDDLDVLTQEEFEWFTEDPEFYAWVAKARMQRRERERAGRPEEKT
jgi:hypothetical protein